MVRRDEEGALLDVRIEKQDEEEPDAAGLGDPGHRPAGDAGDPGAGKHNALGGRNGEHRPVEVQGAKLEVVAADTGDVGHVQGDAEQRQGVADASAPPP